MQYQYLISTTANNKVSTERLMVEINQSETTIKLKSVSSDGVNITLDFADTLPSTQKADHIDPLILLHNGEPLESVIKYEESAPVGGPRMANRGVSFTCAAGQSQTVDYIITEDLHIRSGILVTDNQVIGDTFDIELYHPLDLVNPIWAYTKDEPVFPDGKTIIENRALTEDGLNGLVVRFRYHSTGASPVKCVIGMRAAIVL